MDNLQYVDDMKGTVVEKIGFKPYYKWIIFNICRCRWLLSLQGC